MTKTIPEEDLKLINDSFKQTGAVETLEKNAHGQVVEAKRKISNPTSIVLQDFSGRVLRHQKSLLGLDGKQVVLGVKGQRYDDIPLENRKLVMWFENDFES